MAKTVVMLQTRAGDNGVSLVAGQSVSVRDALADFLVGSGFARLLSGSERAGPAAVSDRDLTTIRDNANALLTNSSGQTLLARDTASGATLAAGASAIGVARSAAPAYYRSAQGPTARVPAGYLGVGYSGKIVVIDSSGNVWLYTEAGDGWTIVGATTFAAQAVGMSFLFADSRGYLFFCSTVTNYNIIYRSTDDGANWTAVKTFPLTTDSGAPIAEDDLGNLYLGTYGSLGAGSNSCKFYKSTDGGANWTDLTANLPSTPQRHIHGCWWDDYRKLLFVTHGDAGSSSRIFVSGDRGVTFSTWTASAQATAMAFSPDYVFYTADQSGNRGVYRAAAAAGISAATMSAATPTKVFDWRADGDRASSGGSAGTDNGYAWWGGYANGSVFFPYGSEGARAALLTSTDQGATWAEVDSFESAGILYHEMAAVSPFNPGWDGLYYGRTTNSSQSLLSAWGLFAPGTVSQIDPASTSRGSGVAIARAEPIGYGLRSPGLIQKLIANYTSPIMLSQYGVLLANGKTAGAQGSTPLVYHNADDVTAPSVTFSTNPITLSTSGTGSAVVTSTTQKVSGANSFKAVVTAGTGASQFRLTTAPWGTADGTEAWVSTRVYWNGTIDANRQDIIEFNSIRVGVMLIGSTKALRVFQLTLSVNLNTQDAADLVAIPENTWFRLKFACSLSPNSVGGRRGRVRVWVDIGAGWRQVCDAMGVPTYSSVSANLFLGINQGGSGAAATCYLDDIRWSTSDPDRVAPITLAQSPSAVPDLGLFA
jgi:hypothetical protein